MFAQATGVCEANRAGARSRRRDARLVRFHSKHLSPLRGGMAESLPYKLETLTWDQAHQFNSQNRYGYTGKGKKLSEPGALLGIRRTQDLLGPHAPTARPALHALATALTPLASTDPTVAALQCEVCEQWFMTKEVWR